MSETVLAKNVLTEVADLNSAFVDLLSVTGAGTDAGAALGLDRRLAERIAALSPARRAGLARCPFALFSLRLDDVAYWRTAARGRIPAGYRASPLPAGSDAATAVSRFSLTALLFARHLAAQDRFSARLTLGIPRTGTQLAEVPLVLMQHLASINTGLLTARFAAHPRFWPDLVWCAERGTKIQRLASRLAGLHLLTGRLAATGSATGENR